MVVPRGERETQLDGRRHHWTRWRRRRPWCPRSRVRELRFEATRAPRNRGRHRVLRQLCGLAWDGKDPRINRRARRRDRVKTARGGERPPGETNRRLNG